MCKQLRPASSSGVAGRDGRHRKRPVDRKLRIVVGDGEVFGRVMRAVDPIAHVRRRGQCLEAVQETRRHIQMSKLVIVEQKCLLLTECRRSRPNIDQHVVDGAVGAAHQLRLAAPAAAVHAADHTLGRTRLGVLDERSGQPRHAEVIVEDICIERAGEQAAVIAEWLRYQDENISQIGLFDAHMDMLP